MMEEYRPARRSSGIYEEAYNQSGQSLASGASLRGTSILLQQYYVFNYRHHVKGMLLTPLDRGSQRVLGLRAPLAQVSRQEALWVPLRTLMMRFHGINKHRCQQNHPL